MAEPGLRAEKNVSGAHLLYIRYHKAPLTPSYSLNINTVYSLYFKGTDIKGGLKSLQKCWKRPTALGFGGPRRRTEN